MIITQIYIVDDKINYCIVKASNFGGGRAGEGVDSSFNTDVIVIDGRQITQI